MAWWSGGKSDQKPSETRSFEAPNRSDRAKCWAARDAFFACLDKNGIVDSIRNSETANAVCGKEEKVLQQDCASSWVSFLESF